MLYNGNNHLLEQLEKMERAISTDVDLHEEHGVIEYALQELEGLYQTIGGLEEEIFNLDETLADTDKVIDTLEEYYSWNLEQLRGGARLRGLKVSGTKAELARRLLEDDRTSGELS